MREYIGVVIFFAILVFMIIYTWRVWKLEKRNALLQKNLSQVEQLYDEMQERVDAMRKYRHDLQKHIRIVEQFLRESKKLHYDAGTEIGALYETMKEMDEDVRQTKTEYCDDDLIEAICRIKTEECALYHIPFLIKIEAGRKDLVCFDPYHITGILMNLLDNALEAEKKVEIGAREGISLQIDRLDSGISILVGNDIPEDFVPDFQTKKKNKDKHGLGLSIAREYARIYKGDISIQVDKVDHRCQVETQLYEPEEE